MRRMTRFSITLLAILAMLVAAGCSHEELTAPETASTSEEESQQIAPAASRAGFSGSTKIMLQGYHWESHESASWWDVINASAGTIADAGFDMVWLPPSSDATSDEGYLPRKLYTLDSKYGSQDELVAAINSLDDAGVDAIADIVINHRVGTTDWADFTDPVWGADSVCGNDEWTGAQGNWDTGESYAAARDIDHTQSYVRDSIKSWMSWLKNTIGYDGWRYDFVKGFAGSYAGEYNIATAPSFSVGEFWPTEGFDQSNPNAWRGQIVDWIDATGGHAAAFDFVTKPVLAKALSDGEYWRLRDSDGNLAGTIGWWPANSVTFLDNHDTGPSPGGGQDHWPFPADKVAAGYAYILTHPGVPSIYWVHFFDWGSGLQQEIKDLIAVRKDMGLTSTSSVAIQVADSSKYAAIIDDKVAVKIGWGDWAPSGSDWTVAASGSDYAVWTKSSTPPPPSGQVRTVVYIYKETQPGQDIFIKGGHDAGLVPSVYPSMSEPITYLNTKNDTTAAIKANDASLDWGTESALDWTTDAWPASWGDKKTYADDGFGEDPENTRGPHWWKFDVTMDGNAGEWFEFKAFMREDGTEWWESDISQDGTPYQTINHWGKKGYITFCSYDEGWVEYVPLN